MLIGTHITDSPLPWSTEVPFPGRLPLNPRSVQVCRILAQIITLSVLNQIVNKLSMETSSNFKTCKLQVQLPRWTQFFQSMYIGHGDTLYSLHFLTLNTVPSDEISIKFCFPKFNKCEVFLLFVLNLLVLPPSVVLVVFLFTFCCFVYVQNFNTLILIL